MEHLVLIGAGPHGLAVLAALVARDAWPARVTVVDPHDRWCAAWDDKLARLDLDRLRSPQVHHPGVRPMELRDLVETLPPEERLTWRRSDAQRVPTPAGMRAFIDRLAGTLGPVEWILGRASAVRTASGREAGVEIEVEAVAPDQHRTIVADAVVVAHNPSRARLPHWAGPLVAEGRAVHASEVDVRTADVAGREVVVVGGGLTAACLALAADDRGARVTLLTRRPLRERPYDVDASWLGPRRLTAYLAATPAERRVLVDAARDGGTIPPRTLDELRARAGRRGAAITLREAVDVEAEVSALLRAATPGQPPVLWLATGFEQDIRRDSLVGPLVEQLGVAVHAGLPEVDDALRLDDAPIFVTGPYAALGVGPACRNLAGARPAAARIAAALTSPKGTPPRAASPAARALPRSAAP